MAELAERVAVEYEPRLVRVGWESYSLQRTEDGWSVLDGFGGRSIGEAVLHAGVITYRGADPARAERIVHAWLEHCGAQKLDAWPPPFGVPQAVKAERVDEIPIHALRDLLGLVRAMFRAAKATGAGRAELAPFERVGRELRAAVRLASSGRPGTAAYTKAREHAERAALGVGDLVGCLDSAEPIVRAAVGAVHARRRGRP